ncbi:MAG: hypothetical protein OXD47_03995 [Gammaproteobacteria bacterium]|nr:hypothetical protein [Gammaproteobacteria bacterium]MCY4282760.1 hypothetical protein [Gammaproteobacteria bacterium]MCY4337942.1 hypothetical protein [Gammaproteobacteria bacterium]
MNTTMWSFQFNASPDAGFQRYEQCVVHERSTGRKKAKTDALRPEEFAPDDEVF